MWQALFGNLALVALVVSTWVHAEQWLESRRRIVRLVAMGLLMGFGATASILLSVHLPGGIMLDLRTSLIAPAISVFNRSTWESIQRPSAVLMPVTPRQPQKLSGCMIRG